MATLKPSSLILNSSISSSSNSKLRRTIKTAINIPNRVTGISLPELRTLKSVDEYIEKQLSPITTDTNRRNEPKLDPLVVSKLYAILEAVADRVEMHRNIGDQRNNWNSLLLNSFNAITLAAATMTGIASIAGDSSAATAMKLSSTALYVAATGMLSVVNKIQPSQLAEEQRNAVRLFKQLQNQIETILSIGNPTAIDVREMMERVLALDKAFPLPLLNGAMLEKFPAEVKPAVWWPENNKRRKQPRKGIQGFNGWNRNLEEEMKEIVNVMRTKDEEDYIRLGEKALKLNMFLAVSGPVLTGLAAVGSALVGSPADGGLAVTVAVVCGALASAVNAFEHGGQVGMVFEMYRSNAGFFKMMGETIESNLVEEDLERRENGEVLELKVGLQLGRSLSGLRDLAAAAAVEGDGAEEFASKLF